MRAVNVATGYEKIYYLPFFDFYPHGSRGYLGDFSTL